MTIFQHETNGRPFSLLIWQAEDGRTRITRHDRAGDRFYDIIVTLEHPVELRVSDNTLKIVRLEEVKVWPVEEPNGEQ